MTTHLSARLEWHDRGGDGHICDYPDHIVQLIASEDRSDDDISSPEIEALAHKHILMEEDE